MDKIPVKAKFTGPDPTALGEFEAGETTGIAHGGTGSTTATAARINLAAASEVAFQSHITDVNPHSITPAGIGAIDAAEKGAANGVATLDAGSKIPVGQIPAAAIPSVHVVADATARLALTVEEGDEAIQLDDGSHWIYDGTTWQVRPAGPTVIFGTEFQKVESRAVSVTTSTTYQNKLTLTTGVLPAGEYRIGVNYGWNKDISPNDFYSRIMVNSIIQLEQHRQEPVQFGGTFGATGANQKHVAHRVLYETLSGVNTVELEWRSQTAGTAASIWDALIEIWRVS